MKLSSDSVRNEPTGTTTLPTFITVGPGEKGRGKYFLIQIGNMFYSTHQRREQNGVINLRCKHWRASQGHQQCRWTGKLMNMSGLDKTEEGYWSDENWLPLNHPLAQTHTCCGVSQGCLALT